MTVRITKQRQEIIEAVKDGRELMITFDVFKKPHISFKDGGRLNEEVALGMLKAGMLVPSNDGLFTNTGQTLKISANYV